LVIPDIFSYRNLMVSEIDSQREEKFQIDLMVKIYSQFYNINTFPLGKFISGIVICLYIYIFIFYFHRVTGSSSIKVISRKGQ
jgi:hypothetical protein